MKDKEWWIFFSQGVQPSLVSALEFSRQTHQRGDVKSYGVQRAEARKKAVPPPFKPRPTDYTLITTPTLLKLLPLDPPGTTTIVEWLYQNLAN